MSDLSTKTRLVSPISLLDQAIEHLPAKDFTIGRWHLSLGSRRKNNAWLRCVENDFRLDYALADASYFYLRGNVLVEKVSVSGDYHAHREPDHSAAPVDDHPFVALAQHIHDFAQSEASPDLGSLYSIVDLTLSPNLRTLREARLGRDIGALSAVDLNFDGLAYHKPHVAEEAIDSDMVAKGHEMRKAFLEALCENHVGQIMQRLNCKKRSLYKLEELLDPDHPWFMGVVRCEIIFRLQFKTR